VSCAYRDRAVGEQVIDLLRSLDDEAVADSGAARGTEWWEEVLGRIDKCEVFVALVSPAYADAHTCRLAAKRAAAIGMPVVRLELGEKTPASGLHPVVRTANRVRFDPDDPGAAAALDQALDEALFPQQPVASLRQEARPAPPPPEPGAAPPVEDDPGDRRFRGARLALPVGLLLATLVALLGARWASNMQGSGDDRTGTPHGSAPAVTTAAGAIDLPSTDQPSEPTASPAVIEDAQQLLATIADIDSDRLPASACTAGDGQVTCRDPAPNIGAVVLTPYSSTAALYDAYTVAVAALAGDPPPENVGDCSGDVYEGEITWNTDLGHGHDVLVEDQAAGGLDPASEAAGRLFCTESSDVVKLVWTQDPGLLVTATGQPARLTIGWWHDLHLELACTAGATGSGCAP
jgi:hypothetical protein